MGVRRGGTGLGGEGVSPYFPHASVPPSAAGATVTDFVWRTIAAHRSR